MPLARTKALGIAQTKAQSIDQTKVQSIAQTKAQSIAQTKVQSIAQTKAQSIAQTKNSRQNPKLKLSRIVLKQSVRSSNNRAEQLRLLPSYGCRFIFLGVQLQSQSMLYAVGVRHRTLPLYCCACCMDTLSVCLMHGHEVLIAHNK